MFLNHLKKTSVYKTNPRKNTENLDTACIDLHPSENTFVRFLRPNENTFVIFLRPREARL